MSLDYYTIEQKNNLGERFLGTTVFQSVAFHVISETEGVDLVGGTKNMIPGMKDSLTAKINDHNQVVIDAHVVVNYGMNVSQVVLDIQNHIVRSVNEMMDMKNVRVNINVDDIKF